MRAATKCSMQAGSLRPDLLHDSLLSHLQPSVIPPAAATTATPLGKENWNGVPHTVAAAKQAAAKPTTSRDIAVSHSVQKHASPVGAASSLSERLRRARAAAASPAASVGQNVASPAAAFDPHAGPAAGAVHQHTASQEPSTVQLPSSLVAAEAHGMQTSSITTIGLSGLETVDYQMIACQHSAALAGNTRTITFAQD